MHLLNGGDISMRKTKRRGTVNNTISFGNVCAQLRKKKKSLCDCDD